MTNIFGTDGIRCRFGSDFLTRQRLVHIGSCISHWARQKYQKKPTILIAQDTRASGDFIKAALKSGLLLDDVQVLDAQILPTPAAVVLMHDAASDCAIVISASHNPYYDNGIKIFDARGHKITEADELILSALIEQEPFTENYDCPGTESWYVQAAQDYVKKIVQLWEKPFGKQQKIVLDVAYGATYKVAREVFVALGFEVILLHDTPTGRNINERCGSLSPQALQQAVGDVEAAAGFAFDGDGDRVIAVSRQGTIKNGDDILALLLQHPRFQSINTLVGTSMTNSGFEKFLTSKGKKLLRTAVGDKFVAQQLIKDQLVLGGEPAGHIIIKQGDVLLGDGLLAAALVMESLLYSDNWNMVTFDHFPHVLMNIPVAKKYDLSQEPFAGIINQAEQSLPQGRLLIRYSGTELLLRIMVEAPTLEGAQMLTTAIAQTIKPLL